MATGCAEGYEEGRRNELWTEKRDCRREKPSTTTPLHQTVYTCTICGRTVTQKSDFWVTADAVQTTDVTYGAAPLSLEVDRCQWFFSNIDRMRKSVVNLFVKAAYYIIKDKNHPGQNKSVTANNFSNDFFALHR